MHVVFWGQVNHSKNIIWKDADQNDIDNRLDTKWVKDQYKYNALNEWTNYSQIKALQLIVELRHAVLIFNTVFVLSYKTWRNPNK